MHSVNLIINLEYTVAIYFWSDYPVSIEILDILIQNQISKIKATQIASRACNGETTRTVNAAILVC